MLSVMLCAALEQSWLDRWRCTKLQPYGCILESMCASLWGPQADLDAPSEFSVVLALGRGHVLSIWVHKHIQGLDSQLHLCALQAGSALRRGPEVSAPHCGISLRGDGAKCA